jgi:hypothetical protein
MYETFQWSDWPDRWRTWGDGGTVGCNGHKTGSGSVFWVTIPGLSYSKSVQLSANGPGCWFYYTYSHSWGAAHLENLLPDPSNYWTFVVRGWSQSARSASLAINFLSADGISLGSYDVSAVGVWEFLRWGSDVYVFLNGESKGIAFSCSVPPSYIQFNAIADDGNCQAIIDSVHTHQGSGCLDVAIEPLSRCLTDLCDSRIELTWSVPVYEYEDFRMSEYRIRATHINTGAVILDKIVKAIPVSYVVDPPYGSLVWSRDVMVDLNLQPLYGAYLIELLKNGQAIAIEFLQYTHYGIPETCEQRVLVTSQESAPIPNADIEVREYLSNELITSGKTDAAGEWSTVLDPSQIYSVRASYGSKTAYTVIVPCYDNPVILALEQPPGPTKSWLIPALLATLGASGGATWALSD